MSKVRVAALTKSTAQPKSDAWRAVVSQHSSVRMPLMITRRIPWATSHTGRHAAEGQRASGRYVDSLISSMTMELRDSAATGRRLRMLPSSPRYSRMSRRRNLSR